MSRLFFCCACGHNLTYISDRRLKCYGCGKYYTENFICRCRRDHGLKYSAEIIAPNKVKCFLCGQEAQVPASLEPPYMDKRGESGGLGSWDGQVRPFQPSVRKSRPTRKTKPKTAETKEPEKPERPEVDYVSENRDQIIIRFPGHLLDQIRCEIVNGFLKVQSLLVDVDFSEKFLLPDFPVELKTDFKNAILSIRLEKSETNK